jgi:hypothetical protein
MGFVGSEIHVPTYAQRVIDPDVQAAYFNDLHPSPKTVRDEVHQPVPAPEVGAGREQPHHLNCNTV